jgi:small GTP-binding protein
MPDWLFAKSPDATTKTDGETPDHLDLAQESLDTLINDPRVPKSVRESLQQDYEEVQAMLERLEHGHLHIAVFGRVSVGKSALLNALLGEQRFSTSPLHGETTRAERGQWQEYETGGVFLIDTPGINEVDGEAREQLAREVASRADLVLFVVDSDLTETETRALREIAALHRPIILVLNKSDRYSPAEREALINSITAHAESVVDPHNIVLASADPAERLLIRVDEEGNEQEEWRRPPVDVSQVKERLWDILQAEGQTLAALNASLFASDLSDKVGERILQARRKLGQKLIRNYCATKGVAVALNPVPVADLVAAAVVDVSMIVHLSKLYALPLTKNEAGDLIKTIGGQMALLMGTVWAVHFISSALKLGTAGLTTLLTGGAQGAVAYYSTWIVGQAAERYLAQGKSWGEGGPKLVVREILDSLDRDSILKQAKADIRTRLQSST